MFPTLARRAAQNATKPNSSYIQRIISLHPPKKVWPPDFKKLSFQEQLRFEKKFKRRLAFSSRQPQWNKYLNLAQLFSVVFVVTYAVLFMDWGDELQPFEGTRQELRDFFGIDSKTSSGRPLKQSESEGIPQAK